MIRTVRAGTPPPRITRYSVQCPCGATYTAHPNPDTTIHTHWLNTHEPHMNAPYYEEEP